MQRLQPSSLEAIRAAADRIERLALRRLGAKIRFLPDAEYLIEILNGRVPQP